MLIAKGANVNAKSDRGDTALHKAVFQCSSGSVKLLLAYKADVNAKNVDGWTPLRLAKSKEYMEIAELVRQHGGQE